MTSLLDILSWFFIFFTSSFIQKIFSFLDYIGKLLSPIQCEAYIKYHRFSIAPINRSFHKISFDKENNRVCKIILVAKITKRSLPNFLFKRIVKSSIWLDFIYDKLIVIYDGKEIKKDEIPYEELIQLPKVRERTISRPIEISFREYKHENKAEELEIKIKNRILRIPLTKRFVFNLNMETKSF